MHRREDPTRHLLIGRARYPTVPGKESLAVLRQSPTLNFQVTVLKVLVSYPGGFAVLADLKRDVALLATSGRDWADRTKRLASRVPGLDIFSQHLVDRVDGGWRITEKGRMVLDVMESLTASEAPSSNAQQTTPPDPAQITAPAPSQPLALNNQRRQTRLRRRRKAALKAASPARGGMIS